MRPDCLLQQQVDTPVGVLANGDYGELTEPVSGNIVTKTSSHMSVSWRIVLHLLYVMAPGLHGLSTLGSSMGDCGDVVSVVRRHSLCGPNSMRTCSTNIPSDSVRANFLGLLRSVRSMPFPAAQESVPFVRKRLATLVSTIATSPDISKMFPYSLSNLWICVQMSVSQISLCITINPR